MENCWPAKTEEKKKPQIRKFGGAIPLFIFFYNLVDNQSSFWKLNKFVNKFRS